MAEALTRNSLAVFLVALDKHGFVQRSWIRGMLAYRGAPAGGDVEAL
ncbi:MAG: hypothetical protein ACJ8DI_28515 [Ktedonobacteraceae bacterium]